MKPHICYLLPPFEHYSPASGGALATITLNHRRELLKRGYRVSVLAPEFDGEKYRGDNVEFLKIKQRTDLNIVQRFFSSRIRGRLKQHDLPYYEYYLNLVKPALQKINPDIIIAFNDFSVSCEIKSVLPDAQIVIYLQNEYSRIRQSETYFNKNLDATDQIWGVSDYISHRTTAEFPRATGKVSTLYNGVDNEMFSPRDNNLQSSDLSDLIRVIYVGRTDATKGTDLVPRAVSQLRSEGENVELTVAGSTWFYDHEKQNARPYIRELRASMDAAGANYLGHVARADLPAILRQADVACVPSRFNEPFGLTALEGMASGCATIVSNRGGLPEFCAGAALIIEPDAPDEFTDALRQLVRDRALLNRYKEMGRARAIEYDWSVAVDRLETLILRWV